MTEDEAKTKHCPVFSHAAISKRGDFSQGNCKASACMWWTGRDCGIVRPQVSRRNLVRDTKDEIILLHSEGLTSREIEAVTGIPFSTCARIVREQKEPS